MAVQVFSHVVRFGDVEHIAISVFVRKGTFEKAETEKGPDGLRTHVEGRCDQEHPEGRELRQRNATRPYVKSTVSEEESGRLREHNGDQDRTHAQARKVVIAGERILNEYRITATEVHNKQQESLTTKMPPEQERSGEDRKSDRVAP